MPRRESDIEPAVGSEPEELFRRYFDGAIDVFLHELRVGDLGFIIEIGSEAAVADSDGEFREGAFCIERESAF